PRGLRAELRRRPDPRPLRGARGPRGARGAAGRHPARRRRPRGPRGLDQGDGARGGGRPDGAVLARGHRLPRPRARGRAQPGAEPPARERLRADPGPPPPVALPPGADRVERGRAPRAVRGGGGRRRRPRRALGPRPRRPRAAGRARVHPAGRAGAVTRVPVIDIAPFAAGADRAAAREREGVVRAVDAACTEIGFFSIAGHGVPAALVDRMLETSRAFFDLPADEKQRVARPRPEQGRGCLACGAETLSYSRGDASTTDLKEFFAIGPIDVPDEPYYRKPEAYPSVAPNLWPERPAGLRPVWTEYYRAMEGLAERIMGIFALAL